jgi:transposase-like protein
MRGKDQTANTRLVILMAVNDKVVDGVLAHGAYQAVARQFGVDRSLVSKLWKAHGADIIAASTESTLDIDSYT